MVICVCVDLDELADGEGLADAIVGDGNIRGGAGIIGFGETTGGIGIGCTDTSCPGAGFQTSGIGVKVTD